VKITIDTTDTPSDEILKEVRTQIEGKNSYFLTYNAEDVKAALFTMAKDLFKLTDDDVVVGELKADTLELRKKLKVAQTELQALRQSHRTR